MKVYIVTSGDYSDYHIDGVFGNRETAEEFIKLEGERPYNEYRIDEWEAYESIPERRVVYIIERFFSRRHYAQNREIVRRTLIQWPWEPSWFGEERRPDANYKRWEQGERAWGLDEAAVEKLWKEQHAAEEARDAGL